jgi:hypothetical protein
MATINPLVTAHLDNLASQGPQAPSMIINWDTQDIYKEQAQHLVFIGEAQSEEDGLEQAYEDPDLLGIYWDDTLDMLEEALLKINPTELDWFIEGKNMGWRQRTGTKQLSGNNAANFLRAILPDTDCRFSIAVYADRLEITNSHHDAQGEKYTARLTPF